MPTEPKPQALQRMDHGAVERPMETNEPVNLLAVVARAAMDPQCDPNKMRELLAMRKELEAEQAKKAFDAALAAFQGQCPIIKKTKAVMDKHNKLRYHFAPLDSIIQQTRELIDAHGFSFSIGATVEDRWVKATCTIKCAGHETVSEFKVPIDPDAYMSGPQKYAAALTFAKRYAFCNAFGIITGDEDTDAGAQQEKKTAGADKERRYALTKQIWEATVSLRPAGTKDWVAVNQWLWREELLDGAAQEAMPDLPNARMEALLPKIKERLKP